MTFANAWVTAGLFCAVTAAAAAQPAPVQLSHAVVAAPALGTVTTAPVPALPAAAERGSIYRPVTMFGLPVQTRAPVLAPYDGSSYRLLGGQPETGGDAILAACMGARN